MTKTPALAMLILLALTTTATAEPDSRTLYALHCMGCHQRHGEGHGTVPELRGFVGNFLKVPGGREFLVQVPGVAQSGLTDAEIAAVLNYTLLEFSRNELPDDFRPYDGEEVAGYRPGRLIDVTPVRARLLEEMRKRNITAY
jgi:mono/diheme cytochrome c family protein